MYQSNFVVICQYCSEAINLYEEAFEKHNHEIGKNIFNESDSFYIDCPYCNKELRITPSAIWSYGVEKVD